MEARSGPGPGGGLDRAVRFFRGGVRPFMSQVPGTPRLNELDYRVVRSLGVGAGSTILLIKDQPTGRSFALKVVKRHSAERS